MEKLLKRDAAFTAAGVVAGVAATKLFVACGVCIATFVGAFALILFVLSSKLNGKKFTKKGFVTILVALSVLVSIGTYHRFFCHNREEEKPVEAIVEVDDTEEKTEEVVEEAKEEPTEEPKANKVVERGTCPQEEKISTTYVATKDNTPVVETTKPENNEVTIKVEDDKKQDEKITEDIENGKEVTELEDGIVATTEEDTTEEEDLTVKEGVVVIDSEESKEEETTEDTTNETTEEVVEASEDDLENLVDMTTEETTKEVVTEEVVEEETANGEVEISDITEETLPEKITEEKEEETAVSVTAIDGYTANINSTVQFKIEGDNVTIEGLDGIDYTFSNGFLNINTGAEATVLTVEVSNSVNSVSFDIVVNGVVNQ